MFSRQDLRQNLLGCLEILIFLPVGVQKFQDTKAAAIRSFAVPVALLPITLAVLVGMSYDYDFRHILALHTVRIVTSLALFLLFAYVLSKQFHKNQHFYRFLNVFNWFNVPMTFLIVPILFVLGAGYDVETIEPYAVFITLLGYVYSAFIITHSFRIPWEMAGFMAIVGLAIDQNLFEITLAWRDMMAI